jgi:ribonucleoside-diphosphate reductase alpha chain
VAAGTAPPDDYLAGNGSSHQLESHASAGSALDDQMSKLMGDAPFCDICGHVTVRSGACYKCLNCGHSQGCS